MIPIEDARARVLEHARPLPEETVAIGDAFGRTLAQPIVAGESLPPFDNSAMDGYAVRAVDVAAAGPDSPVTLQVVGPTIAAGDMPTVPVRPGQAARIMTGAPMPEGADAVVMVERTELVDAAPDAAATPAAATPSAATAASAAASPPASVRVLAPVAPKENVRFAGEDISPGQEALPAGTLMRASQIALAAALGRSELTVHRRPKVAILSTGDELVEPGTPLGPGQIRNSNAYALTAEVLAAGGVPIRLGIAKDTAEDVRAGFEEGIARADVLVSTGGVSVGDYDVVKDVVDSMGELLFWEVAMKPGKPLAFGTIHGKPFFGVPGNPSASIVSFEIFIRPALLAMQGRTRLFRPTEEAVLDAALTKKPGRAHLVRAITSRETDGLHARPAGAQGSAILTTSARADALLVMPADATQVPAGGKLPAILITQEEE